MITRCTNKEIAGSLAANSLVFARMVSQEDTHATSCKLPSLPTRSTLENSPEA